MKAWMINLICVLFNISIFWAVYDDVSEGGAVFMGACMGINAALALFCFAEDI